MKNRTITLKRPLVSAALIGAAMMCAAHSLNAATLTFDREYSYVAAPIWIASTTDLINQGQATLLSTSFAGLAYAPSSSERLNDGSNGSFDGNVSSGFIADYIAPNNDPSVYSVFLNGGFDLSSIVVYSGGDYNSGAQDFKLEYRMAGSSDYTTLFASLDQTGNNAVGSSIAIRLTITPDSGELLNIDSLRFSIPNGYPNYPKYTEIDVFGSAAVPEPGTGALLGLGIAGLLFRRTHRRSAQV